MCAAFLPVLLYCKRRDILFLVMVEHLDFSGRSSHQLNRFCELTAFFFVPCVSV